MTLHIPFDNSYAALPPRFYTRQVAQPVTAPRLLVFNHALAADLDHQIYFGFYYVFLF